MHINLEHKANTDPISMFTCAPPLFVKITFYSKHKSIHSKLSVTHERPKNCGQGYRIDLGSQHDEKAGLFCFGFGWCVPGRWSNCGHSIGTGYGNHSDQLRRPRILLLFQHSLRKTTFGRSKIPGELGGHDFKIVT